MENHIHQSNLIEGYDSKEHDESSLLAWEYLLTQTQLSHGAILKIQKMITTPQTDLLPNQRGYYRDVSETNVRVGDHGAPAWQLVENLMDYWLEDYEKMGPQYAHKRFENIHPFVDGNGRTGRMLMWWHQIKKGEEPTLIKFDERQAYYAWFK